MQSPARLLAAVCLLGAVAQASAQSMPELRPDRTRFNLTGATPVPFQPFTVEEFQTASAALSADKAKPINENTVITVGNGLKTTVKDYLQRLNTLEQGFTQLGITLRTETPEPLVLQETDIPVVSDTNAVVTQGASGAVSQFQAFDWSKSFGKPDTVGVKVHAWLDANSGPNAITTDVLTDVTALLGGQAIPLFQMTSEGSLPVPLSALDRRYSTSAYGFLGALTPEGLYAAPEVVANTQLALEKTITPEPSVTFHGLLGPIPVAVALGVRGTAGINGAGHTTADTADANIGPSLAAKVFGALLLDVGIVTAGAEGEADLARFTPSLASKVSVVEHPGANTDLTWNYGFETHFSAGAGEIDLVATVDLWILGKRRFTWTLVTFPGVDYPGFQAGATQTLTRAPLNPMPSVLKHVEVSPVAGFVGAGDKTFGGACPVGVTRVECRAYPLRDDVADCSVPRWVSTNPTDCRCTFHVGSAPFKPVHCGADTWVIQP